MTKCNFEGVLVPVLTPFTADFKPDSARFISMCKWLLDQGANGLAIFGTTSEANSMSVAQREELLDQLITAGIPANSLLVGVGACSLDEVIRITRKSTKLGCGGVLISTPFYYKAVSDEGVFAFMSAVIEQVSDAALRIYLYHIPSHTSVPFGIELVGRLATAYPDTIVGLKDSSGDWSNTESLLKEYPQLEIFPGSEAYLLKALRLGGSGCITATGGANPKGIREVFDRWQTDEADDLQDRISEIRKTIQRYPLIPAMKAMVSHFHDDPAWQTLAPPLLPLPPEAASSLFADLAAINFQIEPR